MHPWHDLNPGDDVPREFNAVIEIPLGSSVKQSSRKPFQLKRFPFVIFWQEATDLSYFARPLYPVGSVRIR